MMVRTKKSKYQTNRQVTVIFLTTVFGEVHNGPALYANYLWKKFQNDSEVSFHLVTPNSEIDHPRIHNSGLYAGSRLLYKNLQLKAIEIAKSLNKDRVIIHSNDAHCMSLLRPKHGHLIGQFNDYDSARVYSQAVDILNRYGYWRLISLIRRNYNEYKILKKLSVGICNSNYVRNELINCYRITDSSCLKVLYKGIDHNEFSALDFKKPNVRSKSPLLFVGSNWKGKGLEVALKAVADLPKKFRDVNLKVAGECLSAKPYIHKLLTELKILHRVEFLGNVSRSELPKLMAESSMLIFPSHNEALGVAVIEAVASGLPVIASNTGGIPEVLASTKCSRMINNTPISFAKEITSLLENYPEQSKLQLDRAEMHRIFNIDDLIVKLKSIYLSFI